MASTKSFIAGSLIFFLVAYFSPECAAAPLSFNPQKICEFLKKISQKAEGLDCENIDVEELKTLAGTLAKEEFDVTSPEEVPEQEGVTELPPQPKWPEISGFKGHLPKYEFKGRVNYPVYNFAKATTKREARARDRRSVPTVEEKYAQYNISSAYGDMVHNALTDQRPKNGIRFSTKTSADLNNLIVTLLYDSALAKVFELRLAELMG